MSEDPWADLAPPIHDRRVSARRVDANLAWDFFWAVGFEGELILFLDHRSSVTPRTRLPRLRGVELAEESTPVEGISRTLFRLIDPELRSVFHRLCLDVVRATKSANSEADALDKALSRTWHWHFLLNAGRANALSSFEQQGLVGELLVLQKLLLDALSTDYAVKSWTGPSGSPKDFEIGSLCIEVKARRPGARPRVEISSEHQLDESRFDEMYLYVVDLNAVEPSSRASYTLTSLVEQIRERILAAAPETVEKFDELANQRGFSWSHDYASWAWTTGSIDAFRVDEHFPRIIPANLSSGISQVSYSLDLTSCEQFRVPNEQPFVSILRSVDASDSC